MLGGSPELGKGNSGWDPSTLDLNLVNNKIEETYNQEEDLSEIFYYNLNKIDSPNIKNNEDN